jgi:hypothetical protein
VLAPKLNCCHPVILPDNYLRKMKRDLEEFEAQVEAVTHYEPDPDFSPPDDGTQPA